MNRRRIADLYAVPLIVGIVASGIWWGLTENVWLGLASLIGVVLISAVLLASVPALRKLQKVRSSEILEIFSDQSAAQKDILAQLNGASKLDILTVRGLGVIALNDSMLRKPVAANRTKLTIRVLMLSASCKAADERALEVGESRDAFTHGVNLAVERMKELANEGWHKVHVYQYSTKPCWRIIRIDSIIYVSMFGATVEGHRTTMYKLDGSRNQTLAVGFRRMFEEMCADASRTVG